MPFSHYRQGIKDGQEGTPAVFIATPTNGGAPKANYAMSMVDTAVYLEANGVKFDYWLHAEDCHVDDARNFLVKMFMDSGAPYLVFVDDDVGWRTEDFARLLCYRDADIVGGAYPLKQPQEEYPIRICKHNEQPVMQARPDGLLEVEGIPTGFMRISREVIERMSERRSHTWFRPKDSDPNNPNDKMQVIFERTLVDGNRWSGDLNFCREARLLGFKVWVDPEMEFSHQGFKRWEGSLGQWLRKRRGIMDPRLDEAIDKLAIGNDSKETFDQIFKYYNNPYSLGPTSLQLIYQHCKEANGPILECGSGISTIIASLACQRNGQTIHSLEHDLEWFRHTRNFIQLFKQKPVALHYAPFREYDEKTKAPANTNSHAGTFIWYDNDNLPDKFAVAIIDGPPRMYGREGVYKLMLDRIKDAVWIVDDFEDPSQAAMCRKYAEQCGKKVEELGSFDKGQRRIAVVT
jgi:hypothetical protein